MSAWIVSKEHIDLLVRAATQRGGGYDSGRERVWLRKLEVDERAPDTQGYDVTEYPASSGVARTLCFQIAPENASELGRLLWWECVRSVSYRYDDPDFAKLPGYGYTLNEYEQYRYPAAMEAYSARPDPVVVLKSIACYEYQACEHPGWHESDAKRLCEWLRDKMIHKLPGYEDAPWGIEPAAVAS